MPATSITIAPQSQPDTCLAHDTTTRTRYNAANRQACTVNPADLSPATNARSTTKPAQAGFVLVTASLWPTLAARGSYIGMEWTSECQMAGDVPHGHGRTSVCAAQCTKPSSSELGFGMGRLAVSYFHTGICTIIGAEAFHGPVRNGKAWDHLAMATRHKLSQT